MGGKQATVAKHVQDLRDYTNTIAATNLLKEVLEGRAAITDEAAKEIVKKENLKSNPQIGDVIKEMLAKAGTPGEDQAKWIKSEVDQKWHFKAAMTLEGGVYTFDIVQEEAEVQDQQNYTLNITSNLEKRPGRGKLFFDDRNQASVKLIYEEGEVRTVTPKGLDVVATTWLPYPFQNEIIAKFWKSLSDEDTSKQQRLALLGTGSGKSIVMAGIAEAIGRTVMIVPDAELVRNQVKEVSAMLSTAVVNGAKVTPPNVFTFERFLTDNSLDLDITTLEEIKKEHYEELKRRFVEILKGEGNPVYDQIVLQAEHPLFKVLAPVIDDAMVLIDESHKHTFNEEDIEILATMKAKNSMLALTATPTSKLYEIFPGEPLDDLSLGAAVEIRKIRPIKPEVSYLEEDDLATQAVTAYFNDYYLQPGDDGYSDPIKLKKQYTDASMEDGPAQKKAIEEALKLNRIRAQRNMVFSDDPNTRLKIAGIYQSIANGDVATINTYKDKVAGVRKEAEIDARLEMEALFHPGLNKMKTRGRIASSVELPKVDLTTDIVTEQRKDIQRTINSYAISLVFGDKPDDMSKLDRSHKLQFKLADYDRDITRYNGEEELPKALSTKLDIAGALDRPKLTQILTGRLKDSAVMQLPEAQKTIIVEEILTKALAMVARINNPEEGATISATIASPSDIDLEELQAKENYCSSVTESTDPKDIAHQLAQLEVGIRTHIVSDKKLATGINIKDTLNEQTINTYSPVIEQDPNVINGILSGPQAVGRPVRDNDCRARVQQFIDKRYEARGVILTVDQMIDSKKSAEYTKKVIDNREKQAKLDMAEEKAVRAEEKAVRAEDKAARAEAAAKEVVKAAPRRAYPGVLTQFLRENKQTGPRVARALQEMYKERGTSAEFCKDVAQAYLSYAQKKHPRANVREVKEFIKQMREVLQKEATAAREEAKVAREEATAVREEAKAARAEVKADKAEEAAAKEVVKAAPRRAYYPGVLTQFVRENKQTGPRVAKALQEMYKERGASAEFCKDVAQAYLSYAQKKHPRANVREVKEFIKQMREVPQKEATAAKERVERRIESPSRSGASLFSTSSAKAKQSVDLVEKEKHERGQEAPKGGSTL